MKLYAYTGQSGPESFVTFAFAADGDRHQPMPGTPVITLPCSTPEQASAVALAYNGDAA